MGQVLPRRFQVGLHPVEIHSRNGAARNQVFSAPIVLLRVIELSLLVVDCDLVIGLVQLGLAIGVDAAGKLADTAAAHTLDDDGFYRPCALSERWCLLPQAAIKTRKVRDIAARTAGLEVAIGISGSRSLECRAKTTTVQRPAKTDFRGKKVPAKAN